MASPYDERNPGMLIQSFDRPKTKRQWLMYIYDSVLEAGYYLVISFAFGITIEKIFLRETTPSGVPIGPEKPTWFLFLLVIFQILINIILIYIITYGALFLDYINPKHVEPHAGFITLQGFLVSFILVACQLSLFRRIEEIIRRL